MQSRFTATTALLLSLSVALSLSAAGRASAQVEDLMEREIDDAIETYRWRGGPFRLTPVLRIGTGYDSNPLSEPGSGTLEDVSLLVGPGIRGVVPLGNRGLIDLYQEVDFVYFRELTQLRNVNNVTRIGGAVGGRDFVLRGTGGYRTGITRPTSELDVPLDQQVWGFGGELDVALGSAQQLNLRYDNRRYRFEDPSIDVGVSVPNLLDRTELAYGVEIERYVTSTVSAVVEGFYDVIDYVDNAAERDGTGYGAWGGFNFSPRGDVRGRALVGYKRQEPEFPTQAEFSGLVASADVRYTLGLRTRVRGLFLRDTQPSVLDNNWFFVENRLGGSIDLYFADRWFVRPGAIVGTNTYPRASTFIDASGETVTEVVQDDFQLYSFSVNYELQEDFVLGVGGEYQLRESNFPFFDKDRFLVTVTLETGL